MAKKEVEPRLPIAFYYVDDYFNFVFEGIIKDLEKKYSLNKITVKMGNRSFRSSLDKIKPNETCFFFLRIKNLEEIREFFSNWERTRGVKFKIFLLDHSDLTGQSSQLKESAQLKVMAADANTELIEIRPQPTSGFRFENIN